MEGIMILIGVGAIILCALILWRLDRRRNRAFREFILRRLRS